MLTNIIISRVTPADLKTLHYISRKTFLDAFAHLNDPADMGAYLSDHLTEESLSAEINNPNSEFYFAAIDDAPIAYFKLNTGNAQTELKETQGLEIERIYVLQGYQGKKIGELLINESIGIARKKNKTYVWLGVWEGNLKAISFYQNHGFEVFSQHQFTLGKDIQTDIMMKLQLG